MEKTLLKKLVAMADGTRRSTAYRPCLFKPNDLSDTKELDRLIDDGEVSHVHDELDDQLKGLIETLNPADSFTKESLQKKIGYDFLGGAEWPGH